MRGNAAARSDAGARPIIESPAPAGLLFFSCILAPGWRAGGYADPDFRPNRDDARRCAGVIVHAGTSRMPPHCPAWTAFSAANAGAKRRRS
ncbi:hypothetical protein BSIN_0911 [Burkholderia singularis]|uniref:Uncharacterized protein n=1 Tax=Burkholderia singularis TaxID=1503053 RepID=A0A238H9Y5_9BURK|nr:hypothetical protein BSIN_0911 [Burkholderia singularis]